MRLLTAGRLLQTSVHESGVRGTIHRLQRQFILWTNSRERTQANRRFDEERGVESTKWVRVPDLDTPSPNRRYARTYEPSNVDEFRLLMGMLPIDHRSFTFVDYGSGKGRALILAAEYRFERIVRVEFAESLNRVAR